MAEIADNELQQLRASLALFEHVWGDPEIGEAVRKKAKEKNPAIAIPDDNPIAKKAMTELQGLRDNYTALDTAFNEYKAKGESDRAEQALRKNLGDVQDKYRFSDEMMAKTIEVMQARQIADPEAAALIVRESIPKTPPMSPASKFFDGKADMYGTTRVDEQWAKLHTDPDGFFSDVVNEVMTEMPPQG